MTPNVNKWFQSKCDGDWEHRHGVQIETCDNPGWILRVRVVDAGVDEGDRVLFECGQFGHDGSPWVQVRINGQWLEGACSPDRVDRLDQILGSFLKVGSA